METKICNKCKKEKSIEDFHLKKNGQPIWACKECSNSYYKERHLKKLEDPLYKEKRRLRSLNFSYKTRYGIEIDTKINKIKDQNNKCEICENELEDFSKSYLDHNHNNGKIRGVLCPTCNTKLGGVDDKKFLINALKYLEKYEFEDI